MLRLPLHALILLLAPTAIKCSFFTCCSYSLLPIMLNFCYLFFLPFRLLFRLYHPLSPPAPTPTPTLSPVPNPIICYSSPSCRSSHNLFLLMVLFLFHPPQAAFYSMLLLLVHPSPPPPAPTHIKCSSSKCSVVQILCPSCQMLFCPIYFCPRWQIFMFFCCPKVLCYGPEASESCFLLCRIICKMKLLKCL